MLTLLMESAATTIFVTWQLLEAGKSSAGQWNADQLECLTGLRQPPSGWGRRTLGTRISRDKAIRFLMLTDAHRRKMDATQEGAMDSAPLLSRLH